jgi:hypothetical protein
MYLWQHLNAASLSIHGMVKMTSLSIQDSSDHLCRLFGANIVGYAHSM